MNILHYIIGFIFINIIEIINQFKTFNYNYNIDNFINNYDLYQLLPYFEITFAKLILLIIFIFEYNIIYFIQFYKLIKIITLVNNNLTYHKCIYNIIPFILISLLLFSRIYIFNNLGCIGIIFIEHEILKIN